MNYTHERYAEAVRLRTGGCTYRTIAELMGISQVRARDLVVGAGSRILKYKFRAQLTADEMAVAIHAWQYVCGDLSVISRKGRQALMAQR